MLLTLYLSTLASRSLVWTQTRSDFFIRSLNISWPRNLIEDWWINAITYLKLWIIWCVGCWSPSVCSDNVWLFHGQTSTFVMLSVHRSGPFQECFHKTEKFHAASSLSDRLHRHSETVWSLCSSNCTHDRVWSLEDLTAG